MLTKIITKLLSLPTFLRVRLYPFINRMILRQKGVVFGKGLCIPGKVTWTIMGASRLCSCRKSG